LTWAGREKRFDEGRFGFGRESFAMKERNLKALQPFLDDCRSLVSGRPAGGELAPGGHSDDDCGALGGKVRALSGTAVKLAQALLVAKSQPVVQTSASSTHSICFSLSAVEPSNTFQRSLLKQLKSLLTEPLV
jgi:hypothetical protein